MLLAVRLHQQHVFEQLSILQKLHVIRMFPILRQNVKVRNILKCSLESWKAGVGENRTPILEMLVGMKPCVLHL